MRLELLPSGSLLGSAILHIETQKKTILYAPALQTVPVPHVRPLHLKRVDTLLLGTHHASLHHALPDRMQEQERLAALLGNTTQRVKVFCASIGTAQEVSELAMAQQRVVAVHPTIAAVNRVYQNFAIELGKYRVFSRRRDDWEILILPCPLANCPRTHRINALTLHVYDTYPPPPVIAPPDADFYLSRTCSGAELQQIVTKVRPREMFTFGDYAKTYCEALRPLCSRIRPLYAGNQPTLF